MTTETIGHHDHGWWLIEVRPNYRQLVAVGILVALLAYVLVIYPLGYYGQFVAADAGTPGPVQSAEPSLLNRLFFPAVAMLSLLMYGLERGRTAPINLLAAVPLIAFAGYCGLSSLWAISPSTSISKFIVLTLVLLAIVPSVAVIDAADRYLKPMFWVVAATLLINLAFVLLTPPTPIGHAGIYSHKNSLGGAVAFCSLFLIYGIAQPGRLYRFAAFVLAPIALFILFRSQAKTAMGLAFLVPVIAGGFTLARYYLRLPMSLLIGLLALGVAFVMFSGVFDFSWNDVSVAITGDPTFTGRTDLWNFALDKIAQRPWFGYGFHSFWQVGDSSPAWQGAPGFLQRTPHAHEGYLDLLLQGGIVGFGLFGLLFLSVARWISRATDNSPLIGWLLTSLLIFEALVNLLETTWFDPLDPGTVVFVGFAAAAIFAQPLRRPAFLAREA